MDIKEAIPTKNASETQTCTQCGLSFGRGGVARTKGALTLHFCCYGCSFTNSLTGAKGEAGTAALFLARLGFAAFLSMNIMALSWMIYDNGWTTFGIEPDILPYFEKLLFVLSLPVMLFVGSPFVRNALREIRSTSLSMDSLIALGSFSAFFFSTYEIFTGGDGVYFDTATMTIVLVTGGRYLEATAKVRTSAAVRKLIDLRPDTARILRDGKEMVLSTGGVRIGETMKILPGERIPLDGTILEGRTSVNESLLTGESLPAVKTIGDQLFAATINIEGVVLARVSALQQETVHAQTVRLMEEAQRSRSPMQQSVDRISGLFIPIVIAVALFTFAGWSVAGDVEEALLRALTVLVVACPCALGIGTPLASAIGIGRAAEQGILIRTTSALEHLADTKIVAFDKTGTLTDGELSVTAVRANGNEKELLELAMSVERNSEHSIGKAIMKYAEAKSVKALPARNIVAQPGLGIKADVADGGAWKSVVIGTEAMVALEGMMIDDANRAPARLSGETALYVGWNGAVRGAFVLRDALRRNAKEVVQTLHQQRIQTILLSGDAAETTESVARSVSIDEAFGRLLPKEKLERIRTLKNRGTLVMVGDGINDAPSLAAADVGIALGTATDIAKESADVLVIGDHLERIPWLLEFARRTMATIHWNLFWAFGYNAIGIALAVAGLLQPILAATAMVLSSLFIIANSGRLMRRHKADAQA